MSNELSSVLNWSNSSLFSASIRRCQGKWQGLDVAKTRQSSSYGNIFLPHLSSSYIKVTPVTRNFVSSLHRLKVIIVFIIFSWHQHTLVGRIFSFFCFYPKLMFSFHIFSICSHSLFPPASLWSMPWISGKVLLETAWWGTCILLTLPVIIERLPPIISLYSI